MQKKYMNPVSNPKLKWKDRRTQAELASAKQTKQERAEAAALMVEKRRMDVQQWTTLSSNFESHGGIPPTFTTTLQMGQANQEATVVTSTAYGSFMRPTNPAYDKKLTMVNSTGVVNYRQFDCTPGGSWVGGSRHQHTFKPVKAGIVMYEHPDGLFHVKVKVMLSACLHSR